jgi:hypothetical protein
MAMVALMALGMIKRLGQSHIQGLINAAFLFLIRSQTTTILVVAMRMISLLQNHHHRHLVHPDVLRTLWLAVEVVDEIGGGRTLLRLESLEIE